MNFKNKQTRLLHLTIGTLLAVTSAPSHATGITAITSNGHNLGSSHADGSLTSSSPNTYTIDGNQYGVKNGSNLFFSFSRFNLEKGDTAQFSYNNGSTAINNIISRVTDNNPSTINGTINYDLAQNNSQIKNANFWFFNPNGVIIGAGAVIDVPKELHIGSVSQIKDSQGNAFFDVTTKASSLKASAPTDFGFLNAVKDTTLNGGGTTQIKAVGKIEIVGNTIHVTSGETQFNNNNKSNISQALTVNVNSKNSLIVDNGANLSTLSSSNGTVTLNVTADQNLINNGHIGGNATATNGSLTNNGTIDSDTKANINLINYGTINGKAETTTGSLTNNGTINGATTTAKINLINYGTIGSSATATNATTATTATTGNLSNYGTINGNATATAGSLTNNGTISGQSTAGKNLINNGTMGSSVTAKTTVTAKANNNLINNGTINGSAKYGTLNTTIGNVTNNGSITGDSSRN